MKKNQFYCVSCRDKVTVPESSIKMRTTVNGRRQAYATHTVGGEKHKLYKFVSNATRSPRRR